MDVIMAEQITEATLVTARAGKPKLKATPKPTAPAGVSKSEFEAFKAETAAVQNQILSLLEEVVAAKQAPTAASQPAPVPSADTADPVAANGYMPPQYQAIFERYFDPADGFTARLVFPEVT